MPETFLSPNAPCGEKRHILKEVALLTNSAVTESQPTSRGEQGIATQEEHQNPSNPAVFSK
jgi:hypothetical protein